MFNFLTQFGCRSNMVALLGTKWIIREKSIDLDENYGKPGKPFPAMPRVSRARRKLNEKGQAGKEQITKIGMKYPRKLNEIG